MGISRREFCKSAVAAGLAAGIAASPVAAAAKQDRKKVRIKARRVLILTFDGIRVDGLKQANTPNIDALIKNGSASFSTRDVMPSVTLPNYTSHMLGAGPEVHGTVDNGWLIDRHSLPAVETDEDGYFPSVFKVLKDSIKDMKTAYYWNWEPLIRPINRKYLDDTLNAGDNEYSRLYDRAFEFMKENRNSPAFVFLYSVHTDHIGHVHKWMSPEYIRSIEEGDREIGRLVERMKSEGIFDDSHIMFISDHGGIGNGHGGCTPEEMTVPWIIAGPGIRKGFTIEEANNTVNTASTVLRLFGVSQPLCWTGEVPESIFE